MAASSGASWLPPKASPQPAAPLPVEPPFPDFPEIAWRGPFAEYRDAMDGTTEASDVVHFMTCWTDAAVAMGRNTFMYTGSVLYPNVYLAAFGDSNDKKTTAQRRVYDVNPGIKIFRNVGSTEGLADALMSVTNGVYLFLWEEFASFLRMAKWSGSTLKEFLTETFDCPDVWERTYRKNPIHLVSPTPSVLVATTPEWFWLHAQTEDFFGGFGNRFMFFHGAPKEPIPDPPRPPGKFLNAFRTRLQEISSKPGREVQWNKEAKERWADFYTDSNKHAPKGLLGSATRRIHIYVRKLVMTYARLEDTVPKINLGQLEAAIAVVKYSTACTAKLLEMQSPPGHSNRDLEQRCLAWLEKNSGEKLRVMQQRMCRYTGDSEQFHRVIRSLLQVDRILIDQDRRIHLNPDT